MKKFLAATALLLAVASVNIPVLAQKISSPTVKFNKNSVRYAEARAYSDGRGVWLEWKTEIELKNLGFYVYRVVGSEKELVSTSLIPGANLQTLGDTTTSGRYTFFDPNGGVNSSYLIESYSVNEERQSSNVIQTQFIDDLTKVAGSSSEQFLNQARDANPIVSGNDSILPKDVAAEVADYTQPADPVTQRWVAAQPGVRIAVKADGFYRVSRAELQTAGFDVNMPTARWQLYVNGVEQAINIGANGTYIEFYGKSVDTAYADTQIYFLVVGANNGKRIGSMTRRRFGAVVSNSYSQYFFKKERTTYIQSLLNGEAENFFGGTVISSTGGTITFSLNNIDFNSPTASIDLTILGATLTGHQTKVFVNNTEVGTFSGNDYDSMTGKLSFPTSLLVEGSNQVKMVSLNNVPGGQSDISIFDSIKVNYARFYKSVQNQLSSYIPKFRQSYIEGFTTANIRAFDITDTDTPVLINDLAVGASNGGFRVNIPATNRGRVLYAVEDSGFLTAAAVTPNNPSTLSTPGHNAEMIIITHKNFLNEATNWSEYRRSQGMTVEVVNIEDIYDEFNYGVLSADCIRSFLNYAKTNWQTVPKYVLLIGDATYDPKNYLGNGNNFVPTKLVDTVYSEVGSDETMADFNDDGLAEIAIGRISARDSATVTLALNKMMTFEQTVAQAPARGALFASDLPDGYDFEGLSDRLCAQLPTSIGCLKINRGQTNAPADLLAGLNQGKYLVNYSGHGNAAVWASGGFFSTTQAAQLTNGNNLSIFTLLTCLNGYFIHPTNESLAEVLLKNQNGGAVTAWASSGLTTPDVQEVMATRFYNQIAVGNINRIGDLIKDAKTTINFGRDVRLSWVLLGDPSMKVR